jgi:arylsulfatase A-like enzyme
MIDRPLKIGAGALAGAAAGALVGLADGIRAALLVGAGLRVVASTGLLAAGVDALLGLGAGAGIEVALRAAAWGRAARAPWWARVVAWALSGLAAAAAAAGVVVATAGRHNRFLAAGLVALAAAGAAIAGLVFAPSLARLLAAGRASPEAHNRPRPAAALLAPLVAGLLCSALFFPVVQTRLLAGAMLVRQALWAAVPALLLPAAMAAAARIRLPIGWRRASLLAGVVYGGAAIVALALTWSDNLRFAPWAEIVVGLAIAVVAVLVAWGFHAGLPATPLGAALIALGAWLVAGAVVAGVARYEPARKTAGARAAFVGVTLDAGRRLFDFDGDGFARALGGGDCDDGEPTVHPGALDLPGDGVDADCDGSDATDALPPPARMAELPASVPAELDLLLITIDTLRADHLGCYGYPRATSPVIDALAAEGTLFDNGWAHAPSTRYSMPAIASGRWPSAITWDESIWWPRMAPNVVTTAEALHELGYFTGGLFSYSYFAPGDRRGFERGMDEYHAERATLHVAVNGPMESHGSSSRQITDDAIAFVEARKGRRYFLWVHYYDPHLSYETHPELQAFGSSRIDRYDGEIRFTDLHLGRLLTHLRAAGLWDRTAVVLTGDHGEGFGEHGVTEHGFDLYPAQTKVPFIVRVPGLPPRRARVPVGHIDIAPTLLNLARGQTQPAFFGRSLVPDVAAGPAADTDTRAVFQEVTSERGKKRALVTTTRHLIWNAVPGDTTECYDRSRDPAEERDIWQVSGDVACMALARDVRRLVAGLALPQGAAEKMARDVAAPGKHAPVPKYDLTVAGARLGDAIAVRGYDVSASEVAAGDAIDVVTHFVANRRIEPGWRLFFHLEGPAGSRNLDHVAVEGLMPLERWRPGQRIADRLSIPIPAGAPRGVYSLYIGAFKGAARMQVAPPAFSDGKDRMRLLQFTVR